ncbi:MAG: hypothetical protein WDN26_23235, partial [Chitinophagaceae bacterium]
MLAAIKNRIPALLYIVYFLSRYSSSFSQDIPVSFYSSLAEKIYLQLDNNVYTTDQAIWFKAIVVNTTDHTPTRVSGILYAELIDPDENIVERKMVKLDGGTGDGFFQLGLNYTYGVYQLRAYTTWNQNFGESFFFKDYIRVYGPENRQKENPVKKITIIEETNSNRKVKVQLDALAVDSIEGKGITFIVSSDAKRDTLVMKKNRDDQYFLDYRIPLQSKLLTVNVQADNVLNYSKTIVLDTNYLDVQFFPEGGELVQGLPVLLGIKVLDYKGKGKPAQGEIVNNKNEVIATFKSNELGMGLIKWDKADSAAGYKARIFSPSVLKQYVLPAISPAGNNLSVRKAGDKILLKAASNYLLNDSIVIRASCRGQIYFDFKGQLKNGMMEFPVASKILPEGIIDFTLLIHGEMPVAERLYFNERPETRMNLEIIADKTQYNQREKTELNIKTGDKDGKPVAANFSVLVFNKTQQGNMLNLRRNILSHFLLSSDLKGEIENPYIYFQDDTSRTSDIDVLLLTQGWRKYNYQRDEVLLNFLPETGLTVSGTVKGGLFGKKAKSSAELTLATFNNPPFIDKQKTDSLGRFRFLLDDEYGDNMKILIQSANKSSKKQDYQVTLDKKQYPPVEFEHKNSIDKPDSTVQAYIQTNLERKKTEDSVRDAAEGKTLQEVIVKSRILSDQQKAVTEKYGEAGVIIDGHAIRKKEAKWSFGLYSVLMFNFPEQVNVVRGRDGVLYASLYNNLPTLVIVDGIPVIYYQYSSIPSIPPSEVKSFEIIEYAKNFSSLYCEVAPSCLIAPPAGNVIAIYTYGGHGLTGLRATIGMNNMSVPVFTTPREFYAPKYMQLKEEDWAKPDLRTLIHWQPNLQTDSSGKASVSFYNSDVTGNVQVVVEAISANGEFGYHELFFDVKSARKK